MTSLQQNPGAYPLVWEEAISAQASTLLSTCVILLRAMFPNWVTLIAKRKRESSFWSSSLWTERLTSLDPEKNHHATQHTITIA
jgi:hypothetical protein